MARKRVAIVFETTDDNVVRTENNGQGFNVFIEGAERTKTLPEEAWNAAEFWGMRCFAIIVDLIQKTGALKTTTRKGGS
jgi:hypothetical protein